MMKPVNFGRIAKGLAATVFALALTLAAWPSPVAAQDGEVMTLNDLDPGMAANLTPSVASSTAVGNLVPPSVSTNSYPLTQSYTSGGSAPTLIVNDSGSATGNVYGSSGGYVSSSSGGPVVYDPTVYCRAADGSLYPCPNQPGTVTSGGSSVVYSDPYAGYPTATGGTVVYDTGATVLPDTTVYYESSPDVVVYDDSYDNSWPVGLGLSWSAGYGIWDNDWGWGGYRPYHRPYHRPPPPPPPFPRRPEWRHRDGDWRNERRIERRHERRDFVGRPDGNRDLRPRQDYPRIDRGSGVGRPQSSIGSGNRGGGKKIFPDRRRRH